MWREDLDKNLSGFVFCVSATGSQFRSLEATRSILYTSIYIYDLYIYIVGKLGAIYSNYGTCVHCASVP